MDRMSEELEHISNLYKLETLPLKSRLQGPQIMPVLKKRDIT
jgi:hypothetical protein